MVKGELEVRLRLLRYPDVLERMQPYHWVRSSVGIHGTGCSVHGCTSSRMRLNPFAYFTEDGQKANWIFAQFGRSQADRVQRKTSHCEWSHLHIARVCFPTGMLLDRHCA